jgi:hypothetical protein
MELVCALCGSKFLWTRKEQEDAVNAVPLDDLLEAPGNEKPHFIPPPDECKSCRVKQDGQRS